MIVKLRLPNDVKVLAEARAAESGHSTLNDYVIALIRADAETDVSDELEQALLEGLNSGPAFEATPDFWIDLKRRARQRESVRPDGLY